MGFYNEFCTQVVAYLKHSYANTIPSDRQTCNLIYFMDSRVKKSGTASIESNFKMCQTGTE